MYIALMLSCVSFIPFELKCFYEEVCIAFLRVSVFQGIDTVSVMGSFNVDIENGNVVTPEKNNNK